MKRTLSLLLAALLLFSLLPAGAAFAEEPAIQPLIADWFDYVVRTEKNIQSLLWALSYTEEAVQRADWDSVQKAKLAVSMAYACIDAIELDEEQCSLADYAAFDEQGLDVGLVNASRLAYEEEQNALLNFLLFYQQVLHTTLFSRIGVKTLSDELPQDRRICELDLETAALETEYLAAVLGQSEETDKLLAAVRKNCPGVAAYLSDEVRSTQALESRQFDVLDEYEALVSERNGLLSARKSAVDTLAYWFETGNKEALEADWNPVADLPASLPYPTWDKDDFTSVYYWVDEAGEVSLPSPGDAIDAAPNACVLDYYGVSEEDFLIYALTLLDSGVEFLGNQDEEGVSYELLLRYDGLRLLLTWEASGLVEITMPDGIPFLKPFSY